jgi:hypothetical protein
MKEKRNACRVLMGKPEGERPLGRPTHSWKDNIKMDLREIRSGVMGWIHLTQVSEIYSQGTDPRENTFSERSPTKHALLRRV